MADPVIAKEDTTVKVVTESGDLTFKVIAGQAVPAHLLDAYNEQVAGGTSKAQRAPAKDKAERSPERSK